MTSNRNSASSDSSPTSQQPFRFYADIILLSTAVMWGVNIIVFKYAIVDLSTWIFNGLRLIFATLALGVLVGIEKKFAAKTARKPLNVSRLACFCVLSGVVYMMAFARGIELTTAGNTALLLASMPMWTAVLSFFFLRERLGATIWVGLAVTFAGTILVTTQASGPVDLGGQYLAGNLFVLGSAIVWAGGTVLSKSLLESISPLQLAFIASLTTTPIHLGISVYQLQLDPAAWSQVLEPRIVVAIVYSGVFSTGVAYATWYAGVRVVGGSHAAVYQNFVTLVAVLGGWLFLKEQLLVPQVIGGLLTIAGLLIMRQSRLAAEKRRAQANRTDLEIRETHLPETDNPSPVLATSSGKSSI